MNTSNELLSKVEPVQHAITQEEFIIMRQQVDMLKVSRESPMVCQRCTKKGGNSYCIACSQYQYVNKKCCPYLCNDCYFYLHNTSYMSKHFIVTIYFNEKDGWFFSV